MFDWAVCELCCMCDLFGQNIDRNLTGAVVFIPRVIYLLCPGTFPLVCFFFFAQTNDTKNIVSHIR